MTEENNVQNELNHSNTDTTEKYLTSKKPQSLSHSDNKTAEYLESRKDN